MKKKLFVFISEIIFLSSCGLYKQTAPVASFGNNEISTNIKANLDMNSLKKVNATFETETLFGCIQLKQNGNKCLTASNHYRGLSKEESQVLYKAKKSNDIDFILDPEYVSEKHSWLLGLYKTKKIIVSGWGVKIKSFDQE